MDEREAAIRRKMRDDFIAYAARNLLIKLKEPKAGEVETLGNFVINRAQRYVHEKVQQQIDRIGMVRAVVLKGRQQGMSTYIGGRMYHQATHARGRSSLIMAHVETSTLSLFGAIARFQKNGNPLLRPHVSILSQSKIRFDRLDSQIEALTAGSRAVGRGSTNHFLHGSEVAFWQDAGSIQTGAMQSVPDLPGTEIWLESTAFGVGNDFHVIWQDAASGHSPFIPVFVPWFWQPEYRAPVPDDFALSNVDRPDGYMSDVEYQAAYNLDMEQMAWRAAKIASFGRDGDTKFRQEYPGTPSEAFQTSGAESFVKPSAMARARKAEPTAFGPLIIGVDTSRGGVDNTSIIRRRGRTLYDLQRLPGGDTTVQARVIWQIIQNEKPDRVFIDEAGEGGAIVDMLRTMPGGERVVFGVSFGGSAYDPQKYGNRRAEMYCQLRDLIESEGACIPDDDEFQVQLCAHEVKAKIMFGQEVIMLAGKDQVKKKIHRSPDDSDAAALTLAEPVAAQEQTGTWGGETSFNPFAGRSTQPSDRQRIDDVLAGRSIEDAAWRTGDFDPFS